MLAGLASRDLQKGILGAAGHHPESRHCFARAPCPEIRLLCVPALTVEQQKLFTELGISLPDHLNLDFECGLDLVTD